MKRIEGIHVWLLSLVAIGGCGFTQAQAPMPKKPPDVEVCLPVTREVTDFEDFTGRTDAVQTVAVVAHATGYLDAVPFKEGAMVKEGDLLFEIDPRPYKAQYDQAVAQLRLNDAQVKQAKADNARAKELAKTAGAISQQDIDKFQAAEEQAIASVRAAEATVALYRTNLGYCQGKSKISGRISRYFVTPGNMIIQDQTIITTVVSVDPMYAYFDVDERTLLRIQTLAREGKVSVKKMPVHLELSNENGYLHDGIVDFTDNVVDSGTGTLRFRGLFPNHDSMLTPGLFVRVRLPVGAPYPAILIPEKALVTDQGRRYVNVVNAKNGIEYRAVKIGPLRGQLRVIEEGLTAHERVVVGGLQQIHDYAGQVAVILVEGEPQTMGPPAALAPSPTTDKKPSVKKEH